MAGALTSAADATLARLAVAGDRAAYGELVRRALPAVRALLRRMGAQPALADDLAQDAFLAAFRALASYRAEASFASWTRRIAARLYLRHCRRDARWLRGEAALDAALEDPSPDAPAPPRPVDPGDAVDLDRALAELSPVERLCVSLSHGAGFTHPEIAAELALPLGTVKSHVLRGTLRLRRHLGIEAPAAAHQEIRA